MHNFEQQIIEYVGLPATCEFTYRRNNGRVEFRFPAPGTDVLDCREDGSTRDIIVDGPTYAVALRSAFHIYGLAKHGMQGAHVLLRTH